jgi:LysM repeat protein
MTRIQFDFTSIDPRWRAIIIGGIVVILLAIGGLIFLKPGKGEVAETTITPTSSPTMTLPTTPAVSGPPTETLPPSLTPTVEPYKYVIQSGDTLFGIMESYGYHDLTVLPQVLQLNGFANENAPLIQGNTVLIPRQTPTLGPTFTITPTLDPLVTPSNTPTPGPTLDPNATIAEGDCTPEHRCTSPDGLYWLHVVRSGETVSYIANVYHTRVDCIKQVNNLFGDDPVLSVGQKLYICILVTQTPTLTPTGGRDSTATSLPTPAPPMLLAPAPNASIAGNQDVTLQWTTSRPLTGSQSYLIVLKNTVSGEETRYTTRTNTFKLPDSVRPAQGQSIHFEWRVVIINGTSTDSPMVSGTGLPYSFTWGP